ncbi:hypothetical protein B0H10DRAFT_1941274 [Mycena sp. CBHHK59/15]|nr:hypothetical protein B0H10DRAFT_1941274 [Mycena sp. CBHHK59/15]
MCNPGGQSFSLAPRRPQFDSPHRGHADHGLAQRGGNKYIEDLNSTPHAAMCNPGVQSFGLAPRRPQFDSPHRNGYSGHTDHGLAWRGGDKYIEDLNSTPHAAMHNPGVQSLGLAPRREEKNIHV